ncbi:MORN repeat variant [Flavobacterium gillisiae]|uniref:MORN repeat variant n=1 Tax=Flavobacterium gillisiae TaxID=150146 RepID=A0A1H4D623_9FLAO|nr:hypothetical protein [Flavobacterium gillisiae]SEA67940.1 MORN repeat variant [Flavobacterium gillisiae]
MKKLFLVIITILTLISCTVQKDFYQNGNLKAKGKITNNIKHGKWKLFYENGNREQIGTFIEGKKAGIWKSYHTNGSIYSEQEWHNGNLTRIISYYDEEGNKMDIDPFKNVNETARLYDIDRNLNFIIHGIDNKIPLEYLNFKEKYGIGLIIENCAIDPFSFKRATKNNQMISEYLNKKYGRDWLDELPSKPYGI